MLALPRLAHLAAAGGGTAPQQLHVSVPLFLVVIVGLLVWRAGHKWWHALITFMAGLAVADSGSGGAARAVMQAVFGWVSKVNI